MKPGWCENTISLRLMPSIVLPILVPTGINQACLLCRHCCEHCRMTFRLFKYKPSETKTVATPALFQRRIVDSIASTFPSPGYSLVGRRIIAWAITYPSHTLLRAKQHGRVHVAFSALRGERRAAVQRGILSRSRDNPKSRPRFAAHSTNRFSSLTPYFSSFHP